MKRRRRIPPKASLVSLLFALLAGLIWQLSPLQAFVALTSLTDPAKLQTLGERGANERLNKIVYWLHESRCRHLPAETAIDWVNTWNGRRPAQAGLVKAALLRNLKIAEELGLLTSGNLSSLRLGKSAVVSSGPYTGDPVEIDHIVPYSLAPDAGNELANLEMLPRPLNRRKSNRVGERSLAHAEALFSAGLLSSDSLHRVRAAARSPTE